MYFLGRIHGILWAARYQNCTQCCQYTVQNLRQCTAVYLLQTYNHDHTSIYIFKKIERQSFLRKWRLHFL